MSAMRNEKFIINSPEQWMFLVFSCMFECPQKLLIQRPFFHAVEMIQCCLRSPTDIKRGSDMIACPIKNTRNLTPISHLLKINHLHWSSSNNQTIIEIVLDLAKTLIE